jgi:predicted peptidase
MRRTPLLGLVVALGLGVLLGQLTGAEAPATQPDLTAPTVVPPGHWSQTLRKEVTRTISCDYLLYLPRDYSATAPGSDEKKWPLIVFLHGSGARGANLGLVRLSGLPRKLDRDDNFPFVVVSPQCPTGGFWDPETLKSVIDEVIAKHHVDPDRVYLTGLSLGGFGAWNLVTAYPDLFAACAPVCGGGGDPFAVARLRGVAFWVFHGEEDEVVPVKHSRMMVNALRAAGVDVKYTQYDNRGHGVWERTYNDPKLYEWFLKHKRKSPAAD